MKEFNSNYKDFIELLEIYMLQTIGHIRAAVNTNSCHHKRMFKAMDKDSANILLNEAEFHQEFHPDTIRFYRNMINN